MGGSGQPPRERIADLTAASPAGRHAFVGLGDLVRLYPWFLAEELMLTAPGVVVDGLQVAVRSVGEERGDPGPGRVRPRRPPADEGDGAPTLQPPEV